MVQDDLVAGLCYSIVQNYLNKVVEDRRIGGHIFYQGATASNKGIVAAFEKVVGKTITVPQHHDVTGAIGVAILALRERTWERAASRALIWPTAYEISSFECQGCPNQCEVKKVTIDGERPLFYGSRCDKYDVDSEPPPPRPCPTFSGTGGLALGGNGGKPEGKRGTVGIPRTMFFRELMPFFRTFLTELGFEVVISGDQQIHYPPGRGSLAAETCLPIKVAHGHILELIQPGWTAFFCPASSI